MGELASLSQECERSRNRLSGRQAGERRETDPTIPRDDGRYTLADFRKHFALRKNQSIVVRVNIDEAWCDNGTFGANLALSAFSHCPDTTDAVALDGNITRSGLCARPVDDQCVTNYQIPQDHNPPIESDKIIAIRFAQTDSFCKIRLIHPMRLRAHDRETNAILVALLCLGRES